MSMDHFSAERWVKSEAINQEHLEVTWGAQRCRLFTALHLVSAAAPYEATRHMHRHEHRHLGGGFWSVPGHLLALVSRLLRGRAPLRLRLELEELELLLLSRALIRILLRRRNAQVGLAPGEPALQRLSGGTLRHLWSGTEGQRRTGGGMSLRGESVWTVLLPLVIRSLKSRGRGKNETQRADGSLLTDISCSSWSRSRAQVWRHAPEEHHPEPGSLPATHHRHRLLVLHLKGALRGAGEEIQTQGFDIYKVNEVITRTQRYLVSPIT